MTVFIAFLRAVNVGGTGKIRMADLKSTCEALGFTSVSTLLQSGNVVFKARGAEASVAAKIGDAVDANHGFRRDIMVRTTVELADIVARNPFPAAAESEPARLHVLFMARAPEAASKARLAAVKAPGGEKIVLSGREMFLHYPNGMGTSKVTPAVLERAVGGVPATARNWNTVTKLLEVAKALEA